MNSLCKEFKITNIILNDRHYLCDGGSDFYLYC